MALLDELNAVSTYYWMKTPMGDAVDIVSKASALLYKLMGNAIARNNWEVKNHETVDGGLMIKVPLEYASSNHGAYGPQTVINQSKKKIYDAARFGWGGAYGSNSLDLDDLTKCTGDEAMIDLAKGKIESIKKAIRIDLSSQIMARQTDGISLDGLGNLFDTTTSTEYGSIAEANMAAWKANVITTADTISFSVLQGIWRTPAMGDIDEYLPNFCVTTAVLRDGYELSLHPQQRYANEEIVKAGWNNIVHKGAPIVADTYQTSGYFDALNLRFLHLRAHKDYNFTNPVWMHKGILGQPDNHSADTRFRGNLICTNRQMQVRHTNLTVPT